MSDDKKNVGAQDRAKVSGSEEYEVEYMAQKTGASPQEVRDAIKRVGNSREKVEQELSKRK